MLYFNEIDSFCVQWIRNGFRGGVVDERSISDIPEPPHAIRQHYFAGLGGWEYALRLAGWPDREVWTGSCPCQPFSVAGKRKGVNDERHLWPAFLRLIAIGRPATIFGEQVASKDGRNWLAGVRADLEALGYAVGAADISAAGIGAPHIRQRLYWVAFANGERQRLLRSKSAENPDASPWYDFDRSRANGRLGQSVESRLEGQLGHVDAGDQSGWLNADSTRSAWAASRPVRCTDGKWRRIPVEPGFQPLADDGRFGNPRINPNLSSRIGALKAAGNAICVPLAAEFIRAVMDIL